MVAHFTEQETKSERGQVTWQDHQGRMWHWGENAKAHHGQCPLTVHCIFSPLDLKADLVTTGKLTVSLRSPRAPVALHTQGESPGLLFQGACWEINGVGLVLIHGNLCCSFKQQPHPLSYRFKNHPCVFQSAHAEPPAGAKVVWNFYGELSYIISWKVACVSWGCGSYFPNNWSTNDKMSSALHQRVHSDLHSSQSTCGSWTRMCSFLPWTLWTMSSG